MSIVKIKDKTFKTSITEDVIKARVKEVAQQISKDMAGCKTRLISGYDFDRKDQRSIRHQRRLNRTDCDHCGRYRGEWTDHETHD